MNKFASRIDRLSLLVTGEYQTGFARDGLARAHGITVVLASVPPTARFGWRPAIAPMESIHALNAWLADYARREKLTYIDYHTALEDKSHAFRAEWSGDGVHPDAAGYAVMRGIAERALAGALGRR